MKSGNSLLYCYKFCIGKKGQMMRGSFCWSVDEFLIGGTCSLAHDFLNLFGKEVELDRVLLCGYVLPCLFLPIYFQAKQMDVWLSERMIKNNSTTGGGGDAPGLYLKKLYQHSNTDWQGETPAHTALTNITHEKLVDNEWYRFKTE